MQNKWKKIYDNNMPSPPRSHELEIKPPESFQILRVLLAYIKIIIIMETSFIIQNRSKIQITCIYIVWKTAIDLFII